MRLGRCGSCYDFSGVPCDSHMLDVAVTQVEEPRTALVRFFVLSCPVRFFVLSCPVLSCPGLASSSELFLSRRGLLLPSVVTVGHETARSFRRKSSRSFVALRHFWAALYWVEATCAK